MAAREYVPGLVHTGGEAGGAPLIGMKFFHERAMSARNVFTRGALRKPQDLIGLILGHLPRPAAPPRVVVALACATPSGKPAVEIEFQ